MFGALNRFISRLDADSPAQKSQNADGGYGFQILRNTNGDMPMEPWFDFVIGINGHPIDDPDPRLFSQEVRNCAGATVSLNIWTAKGQRVHDITLPIPSPYPPSGLGLSLQFAPLSISSQIYHILSIPSSLSPAYLAGLIPHSDYILGSPSGALHGESGLGELVEDYLGRELKLWVYNSEFDVVREVNIIPRRGWGGEGALGAMLGFGALHRLPVPIGEQVQDPGEVVFDNSPPGSSDGLTIQQKQQASSDFLVPANIIASPPPLQHQHTPQPQGPPSMTNAAGSGPSVGPRHKGRRPHHHAAGPADAFDQYFAESEQRSKEEDFVSSRKGTPAAPPPKAGLAPPTASPAPSSEAGEA